METIRLNVALLRRRVPNLTSAARSVGLRPATVSNLCTGKIAVERAEVKTLVALATLADCSLDDLIIRGDHVEMIETGIKTLDLFAPLTKGGTAGLIARPGMGQMVVFTEIFARLRGEDTIAMLLIPKGDHPEVGETLQYTDIVCQTIEKAYEEIIRLGKSKNILFAADRSHVVTGEIHQLQERLQEKGIDSVTTFLVDLNGEAVDEELPYGPLDTLWQFDADLTARSLFPAVNPLHSTSSVLEGAYLDKTHLTVGQRAKKLLRRYRELRSLVQVNGMDRLPTLEIQTFNRGERLEAYLTQPFYMGEAYTNRNGETVSLTDTVNDVAKILDGALDTIEVDKLKFIGSLQQL